MTETSRMGRWLAQGAGLLAGFGGLILLALAAMTVLSVLGRALPGLPGIAGDFELVEMGTAVAVFSFLPWCQLAGGQVSVDLVTARMGPRLDGALARLGHLALAAVALVLLWRLWLGFGEKLPFALGPLRGALGLGPAPWHTETSYELLIPVWIPYALCLPGAALWAVTALWSGLKRGEMQ